MKKYRILKRFCIGFEKSSFPNLTEIKICSSLEAQMAGNNFNRKIVLCLAGRTDLSQTRRCSMENFVIGILEKFYPLENEQNVFHLCGHFTIIGLSVFIIGTPILAAF